MIGWPKKNPSNQITRIEWIEMQKRNQKKITEAQATIISIESTWFKTKKNTSLYKGNQSQNNMSHNMSQQKMNNIWTS